MKIGLNANGQRFRRHPQQWGISNVWIIWLQLTASVQQQTHWPFSISVCREKFTTSLNGTLQPFTGNFTPDELMQCSFTIFFPPLHRMEISCSVFNFTSPNSSFVVSLLSWKQMKCYSKISCCSYNNKNTKFILDCRGAWNWSQYPTSDKQEILSQRWIHYYLLLPRQEGLAWVPMVGSSYFYRHYGIQT